MRNKFFLFILLFGLSMYFQLVIRSAQSHSFSNLRFYLNGAIFMFLDALLALGASIIAWRIGKKKENLDKYRRFAIIYGVSFLLFITVATGWQILLEMLVFKKAFYLYGYVADFFIRTIFHAVIATSFITFSLFKEQQNMRESLLKTERALSESKLQLLQHQFSPHFLFNNLNILSFFIEPANTRAHAYLMHLSAIYGYLIAAGKSEVVTVSQEKKFIEDYIYLLKQRFGDAYNFQIKDHRTNSRVMLPALCLQELVINAMKHNQTTTENPIAISIDFFNDKVVVSNDIRPKLIKAEGMQTGLANLKERFKLLTENPVEISTTSERFMVTLPTLQIFKDGHTNN